jgi:transcriptional regulator with GAF, ATPase, and Fis domain
LATALDVPYAFVAECIDNSTTHVRTRAFWQRDQFVESAAYILSGATYDIGIPDAQSYLSFPLLSATGEIIGHLAVLDVMPIAATALRRPVLHVCAVWASRELERVRALHHIAALHAQIAQLKSSADRESADLSEIFPAPVVSDALEDVERAHILAMLTQTGWVIEGPRGAAKILAMHPNTLRSRMKRLGLERARHGVPPVEGV